MIGNIYEIEQDMQQEVANRDREAAQARSARIARQSAATTPSRTLMRVGRRVVGWAGR
ncbi:MAG TPA: hypothetical protein VM536_15210 [Chloroflexia bacterium]|nr:hypothetical protein [Chloroflexia bacterium]